MHQTHKQCLEYKHNTILIEKNILQLQKVYEKNVDKEISPTKPYTFSTSTIIGSHLI